jgi:hypothetical protein
VEGVWLGKRDEECTQNFVKGTSWKMSACKIESDDSWKHWL